MKRTYFVPMCVLAGVLLSCGVAGFVLSIMLEGMLEKVDEIFVSRYRERGSYEALYSEALKLRQRVSFEQADRGFSTSAAGLTMAALLLWWAFDRRRLVRKCNESASREAKGAT